MDSVWKGKIGVLSYSQWEEDAINDIRSKDFQLYNKISTFMGM